MKITCYTDGSSSGMKAGQVKRAGWAFVIPDFMGKTYIRYGHIPNGTNNLGELTGPLYLLHLFHKKKEWGLEIISDSQYVIKSVTEWRRKWHLANYEGVKNLNLLIPLFDYYDAHENTKFQWVKGHAGNTYNEMADDYAGKGKNQIIEDKQDDKWDIKYIPYDLLPKFKPLRKYNCG